VSEQGLPGVGIKKNDVNSCDVVFLFFVYSQVTLEIIFSWWWEQQLFFPATKQKDLRSCHCLPTSPSKFKQGIKWKAVVC
jgi:hypothetical protein